jgi:short-subunit dehydrogenase
MIQKNIIIFGANGGLGRQILNNLFNKNLNFFLSVKDSKAKLKLLGKFSTDQKKKIKFCEICDFSDNDSIKLFFEMLKKKLLSADIVFNCVGYFDYNRVNKLDLNKLILIFQLNLFSSIVIVSNLSYLFNKKKVLKIFHIGSSSSYEGFANTSYYCAA